MTQILIVGAGPTGLMMACELARHGISFRIIDQKTERTLSSNAVGIHPRTLELFHEIGILNRFLQAGHPCTGLSAYTGEKLLASIQLDLIESRYHFILLLAQSDTERLLNEHLEEYQKYVERPLQLTALQQNSDGIVATITDAQGGTETITCDWVVGCDGAHSAVRELCHIPFPGDDLQEQFMVADTLMDSYVANNEVYAFLDKGTMFGVFPLGKNKYRVAANIHQARPRQFLIEKEVKEMLHERAHGVFNVNSATWISPFWIHSKMVKTFRQGAVFLAGDAAHIHSPVGAQGMNTGIQDAYNLAWKLALVVKGHAKASLLDSYQLERYPIVKKVVARTERMTQLFLSRNYFTILVRNFILRCVSRCNTLRKKMTMELTQLSVCYQASPIIDYQGSCYSGVPRPGQHAPDVVVNEGQSLHDYLRNTQHNVLLFTDSAHASLALETQTQLQQAYPELLKVHIIARQPLPNVNHFIFDVNGAIQLCYSIAGPAIYLLRPDRYIAYCSKGLDSRAMLRFLEGYM